MGAVAVGEVDVGEVAASVPDRPSEVVLLDAHVEEVAHHPDGGTPRDLAELDPIFQLVQHVVLVAVEGLEQHECALPLGVLAELLEGVEEHAPVFLLRARYVERGQSLRSLAEGGGRYGTHPAQLRDPGEEVLHVLDGLAAAIRVEVPDKPVVDEADAREHGSPPAPVARPAKLDAVEAGGVGELPLLEYAISGEEVLLARQPHVASSENPMT